ncbi:hypothetical protein VYU27_005542 [Nannochloropsis oceanica]
MPNPHLEAKARELLKHAICTALAAQEEMRALRERNGNEQVKCHGGSLRTSSDDDGSQGMEDQSTFYNKKIVSPPPASNNRSLRHNDGGDGAVRPRRPKERRMRSIDQGDVDKEEYEKMQLQQSRDSFPSLSNSVSSSFLTIKQKQRDAKLHELKARVERLLLREEHIDVVESKENEQDEDIYLNERERHSMIQGGDLVIPSHVPAESRRNASPPSPPQPARCLLHLHSESRIDHHPISSKDAALSTSSLFSSSSSPTLLERALAAKRRAKLLSASGASSSSPSSSTLTSYNTPTEAAPTAPAVTGASTIQVSFDASRQSWQQQSTASSIHHDAWVWPRLTEDEMQDANAKR